MRPSVSHAVRPGAALRSVSRPFPRTASSTSQTTPEHPGVYQVLHPMYWLLSFAGRTEEHWPVGVRIGARAPIEGTLVRSLVDYSAPHPGLDIQLPGQAVLDALLAGGPIEVEVARLRT